MVLVVMMIALVQGKRGNCDKSMNNKVIRNAGWLIGGNIVHKLIAFIIGIWTARYLGPGDYGLITYASAYTTFFFSIATLGINSVIVKKFIDEPEQEGTTLGTTLVLQGIASIFSIFVILGVVFVVDYGETVTILVVFLCSLGLFFQELDTIKYWFQSKLESKYAAIATTISYLISSLYKVILLVLGKSVIWFAVATSVDYIVVAIILFGVYRRKNGPKLRFSKSVAIDLLKNSYHYILSGLMVSIYGATDKLMLKQFLGEEAVGYYGTAVAVATMWAFVLSAIIDSLKPVIMELYNKNREAYVQKNIVLYRIIFYLSVFVSIFMTIFAELGVNLLYGQEYLGAVSPLRIVTWYVAFSYLGVARDIWVVCENQQRYLPGIYLGSALVNVVLNAALIPVWGASGAALASLVCQICTIMVMPLFVKSMRPNVKMMAAAVFFGRSKQNRRKEK